MVCPWFVETRIGERALAPDGSVAAGRAGVRAPVSPDDVASAVLRALRRRRRRLLVPASARAAVAAAHLAPRLYEWIMVRRTLGPGAGRAAR